MDQVDFYKMAMMPEFGDEMIFELTREDQTPNTTFSMGAVNGIAEQMKNFMLARIVARQDAGHKLPKRMSAVVRLEFDGIPASESEYGFYTRASDPDFLQIDGLRRLRRGVDNKGG
jgi:hypothetical protein